MLIVEGTPPEAYMMSDNALIATIVICTTICVIAYLVYRSMPRL